MNRPVEDLVAEEMLLFTPTTGSFDVEAIAQALSGIGYTYRDEINPNAFAVFSRAEARDACRAQRRADPGSTFPYVLRVVVRGNELLVYPVNTQDDLRILSEQFLSWVVNTYECQITNEFGTDVTQYKVDSSSDDD